MSSDEVLLPLPSKNPFSLSHNEYFSAPAQKLIPVCPIETLPGDSFEGHEDLIVEMMPFNNIFFGECEAHVDVFHVSLRDIYGDNWMKYFLLGKAKLPMVTLDFYRSTIDPNMNIDNQYFKLFDMLGYPVENLRVDGSTGIHVNPTKIIMYFKIIRDYYLDPSLDVDWIDSYDENLNYILRAFDDACSNLSSFAPSDVLSSIDNIQSMFDNSVQEYVSKFFFLPTTTSIPDNLFHRRLRRDYFTSILPNLQFEDPMHIPIESIGLADGNPNHILSTSGATNAQGQAAVGIGKVGSGTAVDANRPVVVTGGTIRDLQRIESLQAFKERLNFAGGEGSHAKDLYEAIYGESPDNITIGRSRWLHSYRRSVILSEVVQTSNGDSDSDPLGTKVANGVIASRGDNFSVFFKDFGYMFTMFSLMPKVAYSSCPRDTFKSALSDFYVPDLSLIGEQEVLQREISDMHDAMSEDKYMELFGYQQRYQEYREIPDRFHGAFRTPVANTMIFGRSFDGPVNLNADFLEYSNKQFNRIFSYTKESADVCFVNMRFQLGAVRPVIDNPTRLASL